MAADGGRPAVRMCPSRPARAARSRTGRTLVLPGLCPLGGVGRGADVVFVRCADLAKPGHQSGAVVGEVEGVVAAVAGVAAALGQVAFLELVGRRPQR
jgi:hypothetical protein